MLDLQFARIHGLMPAVLQDTDTDVVLSIGLMNLAPFKPHWRRAS